MKTEIEQMLNAMKLKSPAAVKARLEHLSHKQSAKPKSA